MNQVSAPEAGSYAGAVVAIVASLTLTQWGIIVGIVTALATFFLNWFYIQRRDQREQRETEATLARLGGKS
jgi:CDP-diglyceride synthetase